MLHDFQTGAPHWDLSRKLRSIQHKGRVAEDEKKWTSTSSEVTESDTRAGLQSQGTVGPERSSQQSSDSNETKAEKFRSLVGVKPIAETASIARSRTSIVCGRTTLGVDVICILEACSRVLV